jgi:uncharacterized protein (TIGR03437 family)
MLKFFSLLLLPGLAIAPAQGIITTIAGADWSYPRAPLPATNAPLGFVGGLAAAPNGDLLIADQENAVLVRVNSTGTAVIAAGNGIVGNSGDGGPAVNASLGRPLSVAADRQGNIYLSDFGTTDVGKDCSIRKISPAGVISTVFRCGAVPMNNTMLLAVDPAGNLFVASNDRIYRVNPNGTLTVTAGSGGSCGIGLPLCGPVPENTPALSATFDFINGMAFDPAGNLYVESDGGVFKLGTTGLFTTVARGVLWRIAVDRTGTVYAVSVAGDYTVKRLTPNGTVSVVAGNGRQGYTGDGGPALAAGFQLPGPIAVDDNGAVYVADGVRVRAFVPGGAIRLFAGSGRFHSGGDGGAARSASIYAPTAIASDAAGNVYFGEFTGRIRKISRDGIITTVAGNGLPGVSGDGGPALNAAIGRPRAIAVDGAGAIYFTDSVSGTARKINAAGIISTLNLPRPATNVSSIAVDGAGNVYVSHNEQHEVYRVSASGAASIFAGTGQAGYNGDGIAANRAQLSRPVGIATDSSGNLYIADSGNSRIRKVTPDGVIATAAANVAGAEFLSLDPAGGMFVATSNNVFRVANGTETPFAGGGAAVPGDGGPAISAHLGVEGIAADGSGNLYIADDGGWFFSGSTANLRIREVLRDPVPLFITPDTLHFHVVAGGPVTAPQSIAFTGFPGLHFDLSPGDISWMTTSARHGVTPAAIQFTVNPAALTPGTWTATLGVVSPGAKVSAERLTIVADVAPAGLPQITAPDGGLSFVLAQNSTAAVQALVLTNRGGGSATCTASATGAGWLSAPGTVTITAGSSSSVLVTANPAGLAPGIYRAAIAVGCTDGVAGLQVPVTLTVTAGAPTLTLSQTGLSFTAVAGIGGAPSQTFWVIANGSGSVNWVAAAQSGLGTRQWLFATPGSGSAAARPGGASPVTVSVDVSGLAPGAYQGSITISTLDHATNTSVGVLLNVLASGSAPPPLIRPSGLIFTAAAGAGHQSQTFSISNLSGRAVSYVSGRVPDEGSWFDRSPSAGSIAPGGSQTITVTTGASATAPGVQRGVLTFLFDDGSVETVSLLLVSYASGAGFQGGQTALASATCDPSQRFGVFTPLADGSSPRAGQPITIGARVVDSCGNPLLSGTVRAEFSDGEAPLPLNAVGDGYWEASWVPSASADPLAVELRSDDGPAMAQAVVTVSAGNSAIPVVFRGGVVSAADPLPHAPVARGGLIAIYGVNLADTAARADIAPLPVSLNGVRVLLEGQLLPLLYVSPGQIDAVVPFDVPAGVPLELEVVHGAWQSLSETVVAATAQPAAFLVTQLGPAQAAAFGPGGLATAAAPVQAGDRIVLYAEGLGAVTPAFVAGNAAPFDRLYSTANPVSLTIGGRPATVEFAGLAPGSVGEYQINAIVPPGVAPGTAVPVVISVAGAAGPAATIAVK